MATGIGCYIINKRCQGELLTLAISTICGDYDSHWQGVRAPPDWLYMDEDILCTFLDAMPASIKRTKVFECSTVKSDVCNRGPLGKPRW